MSLLCIDLSYASFAAVIDDTTDRCVRVAPIANWARGKTSAEIVRWAKSKGGIVVRLPHGS